MTDLLFVYGTLLPGRAPTAVRDLIERTRVISAATMRGRLYDLGSYPGVVIDPGAGPVIGQVLEVPDDPELWLRLDAYEGFDSNDPARSLFRRVRWHVQPTASSGRPLHCWVYVYNGDVAPENLIESGAWLQQPARPGTLPRTEVHPMARARRPIIGITLDHRDDIPTRYQSSADYSKSVERAGGLPVFLPFRSDLSLIPQYVDALDGILFSGGNDLDPSLYGESCHPKAVPVEPDRQRFELALIAEVERRRMPALGVCLGSQLMNVHRGGSLVQYLPDVAGEGAIDHRKDSAQPNRRHRVRLEPETVLAAAIGQPEITVNTRHKQAIRELGRGLRVNAIAPDGVIEGIEDPSMPLFLAVQWHPENLSEEPEHLAPFKLLVEKASAVAQRRG